jgi:hypothetical protein
VVAWVTGYPQARLAGLGGLVAEGFLEELVVCEVMAAELVPQALVYRGCRSLEQQGRDAWIPIVSARRPIPRGAGNPGQDPEPPG